jgi:outer membrane protein assembly factor BamB
MGHPAYEGSFQASPLSEIGEGNGWEEGMPAQIVANADRLFAMDAKGFVSAHSQGGKKLWVSGTTASKEKDPLLGGGLALMGGGLITATSEGRVALIAAEDAREIWKKQLPYPLRSAPRLVPPLVWIMAADNQLLTLRAQDGDQLWTHKGLSESLGFLWSATPAYSSKLVFVPYSSGELFALSAESGTEFWSDALLRSRRTSALSQVTDIDANPVIADGRVYAVSLSGVLAAYELETGRRIWEATVASAQTPWVAGDSLFVLTQDRRLVCFNAADGRVRWVRNAGEDAKEKDAHEVAWYGPMLVGGQLIVVHEAGEMLIYAPATGELKRIAEMPEGAAGVPVAVNGRLFFTTRDAMLYELK